MTLGQKLWNRIERPQGKAFIGDIVTEWSDESVAIVIRKALVYQREGVRVMARLLGEYEKAKAGGAK